MLFLGLFLLVSVLHLTESWKDHTKGRAITKPFLLILLACFYMTAAEKPSYLMLGALLTSWLGDVLLIFRGHGWFIIGGTSFTVSHILLMTVYFSFIDFQKVSWMLILPVFLLYFGISVYVMKKIRESTPKLLFLPMWGYLLVNGIMNLFALMVLCTYRNFGAVVLYVGAVLFFTSDCILFLVRYYKNKDLIYKKHFMVMLTYLGAEFLITLGILMLTSGH